LETQDIEPHVTERDRRWLSVFRIDIHFQQTFRQIGG